jgi:hypothetical protein
VVFDVATHLRKIEFRVHGISPVVRPLGGHPEQSEGSL